MSDSADCAAISNNDYNRLMYLEYDFVLNNWTEKEYQSIMMNLKLLCTRYIVAKEVGECGTPHLQCYIKLKAKSRITTLHNIDSIFKRCSFRKCRNSKALIAYCQKDNNYVSNFCQCIKIIQVLKPWQQDIYNILLTEPDERTINWYYEPIGNIGKSALTKYMVIKHPNEVLFCDGGKKTDIINLLYNQDLNNFRCIIFDLPRACEGNVSYTAIESIKNGMITNSKFECGVKVFNAPHIIIFSNFQPEESYKLSQDRWNIIKL